MHLNKEKDTIVPQFYKRAVEDPIASNREGRPIFKEVDYVRIMIPGDKNTEVDRKVNDNDKERWSSQWKAYSENREQIGDGTPIDQWPAISLAQVAELKALKIHRVEDLANLSDIGLQRIGMGARELQAKAKAFLDSAKDSALVGKQAVEISRLQEQIDELIQSNKESAAKISELMEKSEKGDGAKKSFFSKKPIKEDDAA